MKPSQDNLIVIHHNVAGIDIGNSYVFVGTEDGEVKNFKTFTSSYMELIQYLKSKQVQSVVMEATGIYWMTLYQMLEEAGFSLFLVNGYQAKNIPGRKSDVLDCEWLRKLHTYGLLRNSFVPPEEIRILRQYVRQRKDIIQMASTQLVLMQKALVMMNIRLGNVLSHTAGKSSLNIIKAIIQGERNPAKLVLLADKSVLKKKYDLVIEALRGNYTAEHLFSLKQAFNAYEFFQHQTVECDKQIEEHLKTMIRELPEQDSFTPKKRIRKRENSMVIPKLPDMLYQLTEGKDLTAIVGMSPEMVVSIIAEVGTDFSVWSSVKHFTSWLGLAPNKNQSGNVSRKKFFKKKTKAGQYFRMSTMGIVNSKNSVMAAFYKKIKSRHGHKVAFKATARKLACLFYLIMTEGVEYVKIGLEEIKEKQKQKTLKYVQKKAAELGMNLVLA